MRTLFTMRPDRTGTAADGVVLMLHGGAEHGRGEVDSRSRALWRTRLMARQIEDQVTTAGHALVVLRFSVRGWNGAEASPVADARWALEELRGRYGEVPVVLVGHSMGARTALHAADDPGVVGVVGLAPWFPVDEDLAPLTGRHLVAAHGHLDRITSARATRAVVGRAETVAASSRFIDMGAVGHYMLARMRAWNDVAAQQSLALLAKARA
ncbi:alpha/beta hydrolase [Nocardioides terrisoli]|uniref:alpha/beta hydrolase n=1 Tax=Nocardioides terrisoli TaxID=3388267 RepID=UPI00287BB940|nr:alpha/beta fold hydrolase [Nocardioides marmorisolisilvae]